ncbi:hypothetical protein V6N11_043612 [Hibiscus sabdariffa]|uniref:Uncharacterized protein n=1 Tax=Hibiscus sabdariffa TaxID=183260 RepID=A0ABR2RCS1_9ROSI
MNQVQQLKCLSRAIVLYSALAEYQLTVARVRSIVSCPVYRVLAFPSVSGRWSLGFESAPSGREHRISRFDLGFLLRRRLGGCFAVVQAGGTFPTFSPSPSWVVSTSLFSLEVALGITIAGFLSKVFLSSISVLIAFENDCSRIFLVSS